MVMFVGKDHKLDSRLFGSNALANYREVIDLVLIRSKIPTPRESWHTLATSGLLPSEFGSLYHELIHACEISSPSKRFKTLANVIAPVWVLGMILLPISHKFELMGMGNLVILAGKLYEQFDVDKQSVSEGAANSLKSFLPMSKELSIDAPYKHSDHVFRNYSDVSQEDVWPLVRLFNDLLFLKGVGITPKKLASLGRKSAIEKEIEKQMAMFKPRGNNDELVIREAVIAKEVLIQNFQRTIAGKIAMEELRRERGRLFFS